MDFKNALKEGAIYLLAFVVALISFYVTGRYFILMPFNIVIPLWTSFAVIYVFTKNYGKSLLFGFIITLLIVFAFFIVI